MAETKTNETLAQRRAKERVDLLRALEKKMREVVETEQLLARQRAEQVELRERLLAAIGGPRRRPSVPETVLDAARAVESGATTAGAVAATLSIALGCARMRLRRAVEANLVDRVGHGRYEVPGARAAAQDSDGGA